MTTRFWSRAAVGGGIVTWMHEPRVRSYINRRVTGNANEWPMEWFHRAYAREPFDRGLSLGCGDGALERDIRRKNICRRISGIDISPESLRLASEKADGEGIKGIDYAVGDFNDLRLEKESFDIVFFHQALHHVRELERCLDEVNRSLRAGGVFYLDEYVGPSRHEWKKPMLARAERAFASLPNAARGRPHLQLPVDWKDPSEAIRSSEIVSVLEERFDVVEKRDYGGNLLAVIYPHLNPEPADGDTADRVLSDLIAQEEALLAEGALSFNTVIVARKRAGESNLPARL
jgi:ubiquinone/menaquinone biosynthesis C-methylase UbiE